MAGYANSAATPGMVRFVCTPASSRIGEALRPRLNEQVRVGPAMRWLPLWGKAAAPVRPEALPPGLFSSPAAETVPSIPPPPPRDWLIELDLSAKVLPESATIRTGTTAPDTATSGTAPIGTAPVRFPVDRLWCSPGGGEAVVVLASLPSYQRCRLDLTLCANSVMTATVTVNAVPVTRLLVEKVSCFSFMLPFFGIAAGSSLDIAIRFSDHRDPRLDRNVAGLMPLRHLCVHGINAPASSFAAAPGLLSDDPGPDPASLSPRDLLMRFMSLGDNCELGIAQRQYGAEPLDLYRFSGVPLGWILEAVDRRFEGIGAASDDAFYLEPLPKPDGRKYWFAYQLTYMIPHETGLVEAAATRERLAEKTLVRFERLGQKLLEDLEGGRRIAVLKRDRPYCPAEIEAVSRRLRRHGRCGLLLVERATHQPHTLVEHVAPGILRGYLRSFSDGTRVVDTTDGNAWYELCRKAYSAWWHERRGLPSPACLPPDFDPFSYIELNPDLVTSGMDVTAHYRAFGAFEGRRYK